MNVAARLGELKERHDALERAQDFCTIARLLLAGGGRIRGAHEAANSPGVSARVRSFFAAPNAGDALVRRSSVPPLGLADLPTEYTAAASAFGSSLASVGVFDRLLAGGFRRIPLALLTVGMSNVAVTAAVVSEFAPKVVSSLSLASSTTTPRKAAAIVVLTAELARAAGSLVDNLIGQEMRTGCIRAVDARFLAIATQGAPAANASGSNLPAFYGDLQFLLNAIVVSDTSQLFLVVTSQVAKMLSAMLSQGSAASTSLTPQGGVICGIETIVSDSLAAGQSMVLIDASAFAAAADLLSLSTLSHGSVQLDASPDSPATASTNFLNLWQLNKIAILAERWWLAERLRTNGVAVISNASYASGFSP